VYKVLNNSTGGVKDKTAYRTFGCMQHRTVIKD
jgi:hypothetical protein